MEDVVSAILQFFFGVEGKLFRKRIILVIAAVLVGGLVIEWQLHLFSSIRNRNDVQVLSMLLELEKDGVLDSQNLRTGYLELVESHRRQRQVVILPIGISAALFKATSSPQEQLLKFVSGSVVLFLVSVAYLLTAKGSWGDRAGGFALMTVFTATLGGTNMLIPTFRWPIVNYIGISVLELAGLIAIAATSVRRRKDGETADETTIEADQEGDADD
jgi:hypothetical protein